MCEAVRVCCAFLQGLGSEIEGRFGVSGFRVSFLRTRSLWAKMFGVCGGNSCDGPKTTPHSAAAKVARFPSKKHLM